MVVTVKVAAFFGLFVATIVIITVSVAIVVFVDWLGLGYFAIGFIEVIIIDVDFIFTTITITKEGAITAIAKLTTPLLSSKLHAALVPFVFVCAPHEV